MKSNFKKYLFPITVLALLVVFLMIYFLFGIRFEENDDIVMALISSGQYTGNPDCHLVFINFIYGFFLNVFYKVIPQLEWYSIFFIFINIISVSLIAQMIIKSDKNRILKIVLLGFLLTIFIYFSILIQFTKVAALASIAGISLIYYSKRKYFGVLMFVLGFLIRFEAASMILFIAFPLFWIKSTGIKEIIADKNFKILFFLIIISACCKLADYSFYYYNPDWKTYLKFNSLRGKINDNPNQFNANFILPQNISFEDYSLLSNFFPNPSAVNYDVLNSVCTNYKSISFKEKFNNIANLSGYKFLFAILSILTVSVVYYNKKYYFKPVLMLFIFFGLLIYLSLNATVKYRVFYSAMLAFILFLFYDFKDNPLKKSIIITCFIIAIISAHVAHLSYVKVIEIRNQVIFKNQSEMISKYFLNNDKVLVIFSASYRIEFVDPFMISSCFKSKRLFFSGWLTHIPFHKHKFDSFRYFINGYGVFITMEQYKNVSSLISASILKNYNISVTPQIILNDSRFAIIEFRKVEN